LPACFVKITLVVLYVFLPWEQRRMGKRSPATALRRAYKRPPHFLRQEFYFSISKKNRRRNCRAICRNRKQVQQRLCGIFRLYRKIMIQSVAAGAFSGLLTFLR
jgi:hypothetical protein